MTIPAMPGETSADSPQAFARSSTPPGKSSITFVHIPWHTRSSLTRNMHTESRNSVPLRLIVRDECILSTRNLPHSIDCKKSATDFRRADPVPILNFFQMIAQSATIVLHRQATSCEEEHRYHAVEAPQARRADVPDLLLIRTQAGPRKPCLR